MPKSKGSEIALATYSVPETAAILGVGDEAVYEATKTGLIPAIRIGRRIVVPRQALRTMLEAAGGFDRLKGSTPSTSAPARDRPRRYPQSTLRDTDDLDAEEGSSL